MKDTVEAVRSENDKIETKSTWFNRFRSSNSKCDIFYIESILYRLLVN